MATIVESKKKKNEGPLVGVFRTWGWILLIWCLYRYFTKLPEAVDELIFKPLIFVVPVLFYVLRIEKRSITSLGLHTKNLAISLYTGLGIGFLFAIEGIVANFIKYGQLSINPLAVLKTYGLWFVVISFVTAVTEEVLARGFLFSRFFEKSKENLIYATIYSSMMFLALHIPILLTSHKFQGSTLLLYFITTIVISFANSIVYRYTKSLVAPVLIHFFWNMTLALYL